MYSEAKYVNKNTQLRVQGFAEYEMHTIGNCQQGLEMSGCLFSIDAKSEIV